MKTVLITGASSGIGEAAARHMVKRGWKVFAGVRKKSDADRLSPYGISPLLMDVTDEESLHHAKKIVQSSMKPQEDFSLVNNAGIAMGGPVEGVPLEKWREQFDVNVFGLISCTQVFLPLIRETKGRVVNMSSVSGLAAIPYLGPYAASKFAVEAISDSLRREIQKFGCKVVLIEPGPVKTPIWNKSLNARSEWMANLSDEVREIYAKDLESFLQMVNKSAETAVPVEKVSAVIERALESKSPKIRYVVGDSSVHLQARLLPFLPDRVLDTMIRSQF